MLESPQDESVVRWGNEGDSFVVLEVAYYQPRPKTTADTATEREIHKAHSSQAF